MDGHTYCAEHTKAINGPKDKANTAMTAKPRPNSLTMENDRQDILPSEMKTESIIYNISTYYKSTMFSVNSEY